MDARLVIRLIGAARTALGLVALIAPAVPARPWVGSVTAATAGGRVLGRALGSRDVVLGVGALASASPAGWAAAGVVCDALDAGVTLGAYAALPRWGRVLVLGSAAGAAVVGGLALTALDRHP